MGSHPVPNTHSVCTIPFQFDLIRIVHTQTSLIKWKLIVTNSSFAVSLLPYIIFTYTLSIRQNTKRERIVSLNKTCHFPFVPNYFYCIQELRIRSNTSDFYPHYKFM